MMISGQRVASPPKLRLAVSRRGRAALSEENMEELREAFNLFDTDKRGFIDPRELKAAMRALGFEVKKEHVRRLLAESGKEGNSNVSFEDFCDMLASRMGEKGSKEEVYKIFKLFDEDNTGKVTFRDLKRIAQELSENLTDEELQEMITEADRNGDGVLDFEEFYRVMRKRGSDPLSDDYDSDY